MTTPIIDPSTLSEEQREAIRNLYTYCISRKKWIRGREKSNPAKNKTVAIHSTFACGMYQGAMAAMSRIFGLEFFEKRRMKNE